MKDQKAIVIKGEDFDGLYSRGVSGTTYDTQDPCPKNGFTTAHQARFLPWGIQDRPGTEQFDLFTTFTGTIAQILPYHTNTSSSPFGVVNGYLVVEHAVANTNVYDSNAAVPANPILATPDTGEYVSFLVIFNRIAISLHNFSVGLAGTADFLYVYKPGWAAARFAAGGNALNPTLAGVNFASSATAGNVTQGIHVFGLAYETETGHIAGISTIGGATGDVNFFTLANASQQVTATGLPAAFPAGVTSLHIIASRLVINSSGNPVDYEIFFVHEVTTAAASVTFNFTDEGLVDSADYLYDLLTLVPSPLGMTWFANRLITWGESYAAGGNLIGPSVLRVSESGLPESFSASHGVLPVFQDDGDNGVKNVWEYKGLLIIQKESRTFVTRDNGDEPNTWQVDILDGTIGGVLYGIAKTSNQVGAIRTDFTITVARNGVYLFDGKYNEIPLTWKIERLWQQISEQSDYLKYQLVDIPAAKLLIFKVWAPLVPEVSPSYPYFLVCDYSKGLSYQTVRWATWKFSGDVSEGGDPVWIAMEDSHNMRIIWENTANTDAIRNMIIGTENSEITPVFEDGDLTTGELNPEDEIDFWHYGIIKLRGDFSHVTNCNWLLGGIGGTSTALLLPQAPLESDVTKIIVNQKSYFPQFQILFSKSTGDAFHLRQIVYFYKKNAQDILGA